MTQVSAYFHKRLGEQYGTVNVFTEMLEKPETLDAARTKEDAEKIAFAAGYELRMPWRCDDELGEWYVAYGVKVPERES